MMQSEPDVAAHLAGASSQGRDVGLVGLGLIGGAIVDRLLPAGYSILGWDIDSQCRATFVDRGGKPAEDCRQVFRSCDTILLSLPTDHIVAQVVDEMRAHLRPGQVLVDTSTGDPQAAVRLATALASAGVAYVDATISGSSAQLRSGSAVLLVGAQESMFDRLQPLLRCLSSKVLSTGAAGSGAQMKLVTNLVLGLNRAALAEGLAYAQALGLPPEQTLFLLRESMAYSRIMDSKGEKMIDRDYTPQAKLAQHAKDVRLMLEDAGRIGTRLPLTETHQQILQRAVDLGFGELDNCAIIETYLHKTEDASDNRQ